MLSTALRCYVRRNRLCLISPVGYHSTNDYYQLLLMLNGEGDKSFVDDLVASRYCKCESSLCATRHWGLSCVPMICSNLFVEKWLWFVLTCLLKNGSVGESIVFSAQQRCCVWKKYLEILENETLLFFVSLSCSRCVLVRCEVLCSLAAIPWRIHRISSELRS